MLDTDSEMPCYVVYGRETDHCVWNDVELYVYITLSLSKLSLQAVIRGVERLLGGRPVWYHEVCRRPYYVYM